MNRAHLTAKCSTFGEYVPSRLPLALVLIGLCVGVWLLSEIVRFA